MKILCEFCNTFLKKSIAAEPDLKLISRNWIKCTSCFGLFNTNFLSSVQDTIKSKVLTKQQSKTSLSISLPNIYNSNYQQQQLLQERSIDFKTILRKQFHQKLAADNLETRVSTLDIELGITIFFYSKEKTLNFFENYLIDKKDVNQIKRKRNRKQNKKEDHFFSEYSKLDNLSENKIPTNQFQAFFQNKPVDEIKKLFDESDYSNKLENIIEKPFSDLLDYKFTCYNDKVQLYGEQNKFSRFLSQAPFNAQFLEKIGKTMTEEAISKTTLMTSKNNIQDILVSEIKPFFLTESIVCNQKHVDKDKEFNLHCGGREDVDVRMMGRPGRPFQVKVTNMDKVHDIHEIEEHFNKFNQSNKDVHFFNLKQTDKSVSEFMHQCQEKKFKIQNCLVQFKDQLEDVDAKLKNIDEIINLKLYQQTPRRVEHRRTIMFRDKTVHKIKCFKYKEQKELLGDKITKSIDYPIPKEEEDSFYVISLIADAGTQIKEFIHGDDQRTFPSFGNLLSLNGSKQDTLQPKEDQELNFEYIKMFERTECSILSLDVIGLILDLNQEIRSDWFIQQKQQI